MSATFFPSSLRRVVTLSLCFFFFPPHVFSAVGVHEFGELEAPTKRSRETRDEDDTQNSANNQLFSVHWCVEPCVCAIGVFNVRPGVTTSRADPNCETADILGAERRFS